MQYRYSAAAKLNMCCEARSVHLREVMLAVNPDASCKDRSLCVKPNFISIDNGRCRYDTEVSSSMQIVISRRSIIHSVSMQDLSRSSSSGRGNNTQDKFRHLPAKNESVIVSGHRNFAFSIPKSHGHVPLATSSGSQ